uniref:C2 domain-containing protein n=1 Tax=Gongylonema pulchrum TaxID=637853 RepID=A0A183DKG6_9BILA
LPVQNNRNSSSAVAGNTLSENTEPEIALVVGETWKATTLVTPMTPNYWEMQRTDSGESIIKVTVTPTTPFENEDGDSDTVQSSSISSTEGPVYRTVSTQR